MFLLRSIFWLSIVFTSMSWTADGMRASPGAFEKAVAESGPALAAAAQQAALAQIKAQLAGSSDDPARQLIAKTALTYLDSHGTSVVPAGRSERWCNLTEDACASDSAKLTALIAADDPGRSSEGAAVPAPPRRALKARMH